MFHDLLQFLGFEEDRLTFSWVSASEGMKWKDIVDDAVARVRALGPFRGYDREAVAGSELAGRAA